MQILAICGDKYPRNMDHNCDDECEDGQGVLEGSGELPLSVDLRLGHGDKLETSYKTLPVDPTQTQNPRA